MDTSYHLKRTTTADSDFQQLVFHLDHELWNELKEDQATYDQHNKVPDIKTAVLVYQRDEAVACGCFKKVAADTVEIKRMFVQKPYRGKGLSKQVLGELEKWALEEGFKQAVLETSIHFTTAKTLYQKSGYNIIPNYGPYVGLAESVCMKKQLAAQG
ncbi:MAG TPA: GNAT family N-acetyltransferase [Flavisolibacter sp.]|nr:GNAT family N-acetyltransferase [Flavisolibacter sp.]